MFNSNKKIDNFINHISHKVTEIKGINGLISDISISGYLIRGLLKKYNLYKPLLNSIRANINKLKLELLKANASIKENKLRNKTPNSISNSIPKALATQGN
jgi:hypothetical protein